MKMSEANEWRYGIYYYMLSFVWKGDMLPNWNIKGSFNGTKKTAGLTLDKAKARIYLSEARLDFNNKEFNRKQN